MFEQFKPKEFRQKSLAAIDAANQIINEYTTKGFSLTVRQLYYQFVARGLIENKKSEYNRLKSVISDARLAGLIDWDAIVDRTRNLRRSPSWQTPEGIMEDTVDQYRENPWQAQEFRPEVWIEKDALVGVIEGVCDEWRVPFFACRGYNSQSEAYAAGKRFDAHLAAGLRPLILHLGDHDPSGLDMTRDNRDRLTMFARDDIEVRRLALNMNQVEQYNPPPNFAKMTDTRAAEYVQEFGSSSWELDALNPETIAALISNEIAALVDFDQWGAAMDAERQSREELKSVLDNWGEVSDYLSDQPGTPS